MFSDTQDTDKNPLVQGTLFSLPSIIFITLLTIVSQIGNLYFSDLSLSALIRLLSKSVFPLISSGIAYSIGGIKTVVAGFIGGILTQSGISFSSLGGNIHSFSGLYGCIMIGKIAGKSLSLIRKLSILKSKQEKSNIDTLTSFLAFCTTLISALTISEISVFVNLISTALLSDLSAPAPLLACIVSGVLVCSGGMGAVSSGASLFSTAALATGQGQMLIGVSAALIIPGASIGIYSTLYPSHFSKIGRICAYTSLFGGLLGAEYSSLPFFTAKPIKMIIASAPGGCVASLLCVLFRCNTNTVSKGLQTVLNCEKPLCFLLSVICGVLVSVYIMSLVFDIREESNEARTDTASVTKEVTA